MLLAWGACLAVTAAAPSQQQPQTKPQTQSKPQSKWFSLRVHATEVSRAAFRACDGDADDRLSIFEARECLERMGSLEEPEGFRQLDADKNGQLSWPEFDRHYRAVCERGGTFRLRPMRPFQPPRRPDRASAAERAARTVVQLGDKNQDGVLDGAELRALLKEFKLPEGLGKQGLMLLDTNRSDTVDEKELLLLVQTVPGLINLGSAEGAVAEAPGPAGPDTDRDGEVTHAELDAALRLVDPGVARWSGKVFADADADKDGVLTGDEIGATGTKR